jgi:hypothetical protein
VHFRNESTELPAVCGHTLTEEIIGVDGGSQAGSVIYPRVSGPLCKRVVGSHFD